MRRGPAHLVLFAGLLAVSTSGPFLVEARMDALALVFHRMAWSSVLFLAWAAARRELRVAAGEGLRLVIGALLLTAHFVLWIKAFDLTDYASNLVLLVAQPIIAAIVSLRLGARHGRTTWLAVGLATLGLAIVAGGDFRLGGRALLGDAFCVVAGLGITLFYVVTRRARAGTPLPTFMGLTFLVGAAALAPLLALTGAPVLTYGRVSWAWLAALVLVTTVAGHGLMNLAARHVSLFTVNLVIVLEPALAIGLGHVMFGATVRPATVAGGALLVVAVVVGLRGQQAALD